MAPSGAIQTPPGVKIIALLAFLEGGVLAGFWGYIVVVRTMASSFGDLPEVGLLFAFGVARMAMAAGLLRMRRWARIAEIGICALIITIALISLGTLYGEGSRGTEFVIVSAILMISIAKVAYLGRPSVRGAFRSLLPA